MENYRKNNVFKNVTIVSGTTIISRIFGFFRDMTFFAFFGVSDIGAAFLLAFSYPNIFRKLLGEGALASAIIPVLSAQHVKHGQKSMLKLFSHILTRLFIILLGMLGLLYALIFLINYNLHSIKWKIALLLTAMLLPYMVLVCLAAAVSAALNVLGQFFIPSINQVWVNLTMILALLVGHFVYKLSDISLVYCLIFGTLGGGLLQLIIPISSLYKVGWRLKSVADVPELKRHIADVWKLFIPGIFGAAIEQFNLMISRTIAYGLSASAISLLYLASRIIELPVGVFGLAISTVSFPSMAKSINSKEGRAKVGNMFNKFLAATMWILIPSAVGIFAIKKQILSVFFEKGNFVASDVYSACPILNIYCISMIFSGALALFVRGFHSMRDMKTPVFVGCGVLLINVALSLLLMHRFEAVGLATATTCACIFQAITLGILLKRKIKELSLLSELKNYITTIYGSVLVLIIALAIRQFISLYFPFGPRMNDTLILVLAPIFSLITYLLVCKNFVREVFFPRKHAYPSIKL